MRVSQRTRSEEGDAIEVLRVQHRDIDQSLEVLGRAGVPAPRGGVVTELADLCAVHLAIEDRLLYPNIGASGPEDHRDLKRLLAALLEADLRREPIDALARGLKDEMRRHAADLERRVFPLTRRRLDAVRLRRLGYEMRVLEFELRTDVSPRLSILAEVALAEAAPALPA